MTKRFFVFIFSGLILLQGCAQKDQIVVTMPSSDETAQIQDLKYPFSAEETENTPYWGDIDALLAKVQENKDFKFSQGQEIVFPEAKEVSRYDQTGAEDFQNLVESFVFDDKTYKLFATDTESNDNIISDNYEILDDQGVTLFEAPMNYGAEGPIIDFRLVNDLPTFTYQSGTNSDSVQNIFYNGETMNEKYGFETSHFLFSYKDKLGFVAQKDGKEHIFFNGKIVSRGYDSIPTSSCCMTLPEVFKVYDNGALVFRATNKDDSGMYHEYWVVEVDLNPYL